MAGQLLQNSLCKRNKNFPIGFSITSFATWCKNTETNSCKPWTKILFLKNENYIWSVSYPRAHKQQKKREFTNCSQLKVHWALSSCSFRFLTYHSWLTQLDVVGKDPEGQYSRALSDQGKGIPNLMALCGKCLISSNSNPERWCELGDLICHEESDHCYGYQTMWTTEGSSTAPASWYLQAFVSTGEWW